MGFSHPNNDFFSMIMFNMFSTFVGLFSILHNDGPCFDVLLKAHGLFLSQCSFPDRRCVYRDCDGCCGVLDLGSFELSRHAEMLALS